MKNLRARLRLEPLEERSLLSASSTLPAVGSLTYSADGTGNNLLHPDWGSTGEQLLRFAPAEYTDGISSPAGADRPSPRAISNALADQGGEDIISDRMLSAMIYAWGQFIDHDIGLTPTGGTEPLNIPVPTGDPSFDPNSTGTKVIPTSRSVFDPTTGTSNPRQQINTITAWLDGSMVYGSDAATATALRTLSGGKLKTSEGDLLPLNNAATFPNGTLPMVNDAHLVPNDQLFAAGDVRANENIELTALQTLFVREHNYWATRIAAANPRFTDEQIFQAARSRVIAEIQSITFNEWLPAVLGRGAIDPYRGYNPRANPELSNEFSTAAFRFGHSLLGDDVEFLDNNGQPVGEEVPLSGAFFNPDLVKEFNIAPVLKYLASDPASELDPMVVDGVRNFLFGPPGAGGLDLASLNIQRGRDHGLADYNAVRQAYGLRPVTSFAQITSDPIVQAKLKEMYGTVNNIDLWVGALAEDHVAGASVGPTLRTIIADQFERLRDGDRLWYQRTLGGTALRQVETTTLADVIKRNTDLSNLQSNAFFFQATISGTVFTDGNGDGRQGRNEPGLAGRVVELVAVEDNEVVATARTDRLGNYSFDVLDGVRTGEYQVRLQAPAGSTQPPLVSRTVAVTRGEQVIRDVNLGVPAGQTTTPRNVAADLVGLLMRDMDPWGPHGPRLPWSR